MMQKAQCVETKHQNPPPPPPKYMAAADVIVTKPGGLTTAESLASGLAMVIVNPYPGQEMRNTDNLLENGIAVKVIGGLTPALTPALTVPNP